MTPDEIEKILDGNDGKSLSSIYHDIVKRHNSGAVGEEKHAERDAILAVIIAVAIKQMQKLDTAATKLTKVGIWIAAVGVLLALIQVVLAVIHK